MGGINPSGINSECLQHTHPPTNAAAAARAQTDTDRF